MFNSVLSHYLAYHNTTALVKTATENNRGEQMKIIVSCKQKLLIPMLTIFLSLLHMFLKRDQKMILFTAFDGRGFLDNPRAIFESMRDNPKFGSYTFVWAMNQPINILGSKVIKKGSVSYYYYLVKSKYWVFNYKLPEYVIKKPDQVYLQTWHGTPLKRLAHDILDNGDTYYRSKQTYQQMVGSYDKESSLWDYLISPNTFSTEVFMSCFQISDQKILETGYPRNDVLFQPTPEKIGEIKQKYGVPQDKQIILYAPTWRDDDYNLKGYKFDLPVNFNRWHDVLGEDYFIIFKPHYLIANQIYILPELKGFITVISPTVDINELYLMSDQLVTDYSSVFFDYANLNRPIYFYMPDLEHYEEVLRGFYLKVPESLPGEVTCTETALLNLIKHNQFDFKRLTQFNKKFNALQNGRVSEKVIEEVFNEN